MPSHLPPGKQDQSRAPFLQRVVLHAFAGTTDPSDSLLAPRTFGLRPYMLGLCPTRPPGRVSPVPPCSFPACRRLGPRGESSIRSGQECCLLPSPRHDRLGPPKHLSADNLTNLLRSLIVAARWFAPLSFKGFRHSARLGRISPSGWSLLPGAPALTRTGLSPARTMRLSGRAMVRSLAGSGER